ncbi:hypothetical protein [Cupriavidus numazuensis]|uniref:hypothetical protein n=1 Tax=Cupriavidus numazuensis TaxID=221992 RepID=UPI001BAB838D|nr:hypothetical protein [Cupriavidus numazuensis]
MSRTVEEAEVREILRRALSQPPARGGGVMLADPWRDEYGRLKASASATSPAA